MDYFKLPSFMKKISIEHCLTELRIPPKFVALHGAQLPFDCRLVMPSGQRWQVRLLNIASGCHFHTGWSEFRLANNIIHDDVLTFTMVDAGIFYVNQYNPRMGCPRLSDLQEDLYGDPDYSDASDVDTSDDYVPSDTDGGDSSEENEYAPDPEVLDDGCPTFTVSLDRSNISRSLEIPMAFWRRHIQMNALQDPVYFNVNGNSWFIVLGHSDTNFWVKRGWRRFKEANNIVVGTRCHFKLIDRNEVQFYVWFDRE
ncbi:B3 domain-containing protein REM1-like [Salvia splendens]|uniref:B3 domain-containing protein REM1-like n=1 Tax=Salvia splendens TaxID=180675 RepID=UPI001C259D58|nr:B3 domain-containing protein REM1-like [Salvia splendens]